MNNIQNLVPASLLCAILLSGCVAFPYGPDDGGAYRRGPEYHSEPVYVAPGRPRDPVQPQRQQYRENERSAHVQGNPGQVQTREVRPADTQQRDLRAPQNNTSQRQQAAQQPSPQQPAARQPNQPNSPQPAARQATAQQPAPQSDKGSNKPREDGKGGAHKKDSDKDH